VNVICGDGARRVAVALLFTPMRRDGSIRGFTVTRVIGMPEVRLPVGLP
jgi:hypothetical protein